MTNEMFLAALDAAILEGRGSGEIGKALNVRSETVRRRRSALKRAGHTINHPSNARRSEARGYNAQRS